MRYNIGWIWAVLAFVWGGSGVGLCFGRLDWFCRLRLVVGFLVLWGSCGSIVSFMVVLGEFG